MTNLDLHKKGSGDTFGGKKYPCRDYPSLQ